MAFTWVDLNRRYFVSTCSSLSPRTPYTRKRLRQVSLEPNAPPEIVELTVPQPQAAEMYYNACAMIDMHNRSRQDELKLEHKVKTMTRKRVNLSMLEMCIVDTYLVFKPVACNKRITKRDFYIELAHQLIGKDFDSVGLRGRQMIATESVVYTEGELTSGVDIRMTPVKCKKRKSDGSFTTHRTQGRCGVCKVESTSMCSECAKDASLGDKVPFICHTTTGTLCWPTHVKTVHKIYSTL
jgi:hypothetical protein